MEPETQKYDGQALHDALTRALMLALEPRYDENKNLIPVPAAFIKEVREFLKDNDFYIVSPESKAKVNDLLSQAAQFVPGVYHAN